MSGTRRQPTFGGAFRSLRKDLDDMKRDTRKRYLDSACLDDKHCLDSIQGVEKRIIEAVDHLPMQRIFKNMNGHRHVHTFSQDWKMLQTMTSKWKSWCSTWREHVEQRGDLIASREWKEDEGILEKLHNAFTNAAPKGYEKDIQWTEDYTVESCLIAGIHALSTDSKDTQYPTTSSDVPPPTSTAVASDNLKPTFGYFFRLFLKDLKDLIDSTKLEGHYGTMTISNEKLEEIRKKKEGIVLSADRLQEDTFLSHMVCSWPKSHEVFQMKWNEMFEVSHKWDCSKAVRFDIGDWQCDRMELNWFLSKGEKAEPKGLLGHPGWTEDYCAACCLTTTKPPYILSSEETWAHSQGITFERLDTYSYEESVNITFGGAWRRLVQDLSDMKKINRASAMEDYGKRDCEYWLRIHDLELRIIQSVHKLPTHPLLHRMGNGLIQGSGKTDFRVKWTDLVKLTKKWELSSFIWTHANPEILVGRDWQKDRDIMGRLYISAASPEKAADAPEWTENSLPASELMKADWFQGDKR